MLHVNTTQCLKKSDKISDMLATHGPQKAVHYAGTLFSNGDVAQVSEAARN
jgi:hypothetical protein